MVRTHRVSVVSVTPFLWFKDQAEPAAKLYTSLFPNSKIRRVQRSRSRRGRGKVFTVEFTLAGMPFIALNGGPMYKFSSAFSLLVSCSTQDQIDSLWATLSRGRKSAQCGWITDRFGLTWQIVPERIGEMLADPDPERARRTMAALEKMTKLDIATLEAAARGD
jgi:predicted 3-demethylubiquinone-9 3-methyltransferase (glyoxalase superfamily)